MASEPSTAPLRAVDKLRFTLRKDGSLRWLSHHDLLRTFERMLRRAELPVHHSRGFHPHPRLIFALSLPLGVIGLAEIVEVEFDELIEPEIGLRRLNDQAPPGLTLLDAHRIPVGIGARVVGLCYAIQVPPDRRLDLAERVRSVLESNECPIERTRPPRRMVDLRPYLRDLRLDTTGRLEVDLALTAAGTARPDEILALLHLSDLPDAGFAVERCRLDLLNDTETSPQPDSVDAD